MPERQSSDFRDSTKTISDWYLITLFEKYARAFASSYPEAVFLVMCDPSMNEL